MRFGHTVIVLNIQSLLESHPLVLGKKVAEVAHSDIAILIRADRLHGISVVDGESEVARSVSVHACGSIGEVHGDVLIEHVVVAYVAYILEGRPEVMWLALSDLLRIVC